MLLYHAIRKNYDDFVYPYHFDGENGTLIKTDKKGLCYSPYWGRTSERQKGMVADVAIHRDDPSNPHAHVMLTMRDVTPEGFGKKNRSWNQKEQLEATREQWAVYANRALEAMQSEERISHLSNEARGIEQLPTTHLGPNVVEMEKRGMATDRGQPNRDVATYNTLVTDLNQYRQTKDDLTRKMEKDRAVQAAPAPSKGPKKENPDVSRQAKRITETVQTYKTPEKMAERLAQLDAWAKKVAHAEKALKNKERAFEEVEKHYRQMDHSEADIEASRKRLAARPKNPLKFKEALAIKDKENQNITKEQRVIRQHQGALV